MNAVRSIVAGVLSLAAGAVGAGTMKSSLDYVQGGLVAMWDGYENSGRGYHRESATKWVDLVQGVEIDIPGWVTVEETSLLSSSALSNVAVTTNLIEGLSSSDAAWTIEIVQQSCGWRKTDINYDNLQNVFNTPRGTLGYRKNSEKGFYFYGPYSATQCSLQNWSHATAKVADIHTMTAKLGADQSTSAIWMDAVRDTVSYNGGYTENRSTVFSFFGNLRMDIRVYAIRVYNRELTSAEIAANHAVDVTRFVDGNCLRNGLYVMGSPEEFGDVEPAYGFLADLPASGSFTAKAPASWMSDDGKTRASCAGWRLEREDGTVTTGDVNSVTFDDASVLNNAILTWLWNVEYKVTLTADDGGTVSKSSEWVARGGTFAATATPSDGLHAFFCWRDGAGNVFSRDAALSLTVDEPVDLTAEFGNVLYAEPGNGFDNAGAGTEAAPYSPLKYAIEKASDGDTIYLKSDTYSIPEELVIGKGICIRSLTGNRDDVILALSGGHRLAQLNHSEARISQVTLVGSSTGISVSGGGVLIAAGGGTLDHVTIRGFKVTAYNTSGGGIYISAPASADTVSLVDSVVVSNCGATCIHGSGGHGLSMAGGIVRNSLFVHNAPSSESDSGSGGAVRATGGELVNCTVALNKSTYAATGVHASGTARVRDCVISQNTLTGSLTPHAQSWYGTASCFSNCVCSTYVNDFCFAEEDPYENVAAENLLPSPLSHALNGSTAEPWMEGGADIAGNPRTSGPRPDLGAFEKPVDQLSADFAADTAEGFAPVTVNYTVGVCAMTAEDTACLWDWNGDGETDEVTFGLAAQHVFDPGAYTVGLVVSNVTTDATYAVPRKLAVKAVSSTLYVVRDNPNAAPPYATRETAAATLDAAAAAAIDGCTIVLSADTHLVGAEIVLDRAIKVRGATGRPEDVILKAKSSGYRLFRMLDPAAEVLDLTIQGFSVSGNGGGISIGASGGTVSNCVIRSCAASGYAVSGGGIYITKPESDDTVSLVDSVVVSNCSCVCQDGSGGNGICMAGGTVRNSLFIFNLQAGSWTTGSGGAVLASGGVVENCTVALNTCACGATGVYASGKAQVRDCVIGENEQTGSLTPLANSWKGTPSCFSNCVCSTYVNDDCSTEVHPFADAARADLSPSPLSKAVDGCAYKDWMASVTDIMGMPRVSGPRPDIGAVEMDKSQFSASFAADAEEGFAPVEVTYTVAVNGAEADEIACYWDWTGDGVYDEVTEGLSARHTFSYCVTDVGMFVSNKTTGAVFQPPTTAPVKSVGKTLYVRAESTTPQAPYATWETAAAKLADANDMAIDGCEIVVSNGTHTVNREIVLGRKVTIRGLDGVATNVIVKAAGTGYRFCQLAHAGTEVRDLTVQGFYVAGSGGGIYIGTTGGVVSNCVIRGCTAHSYATSGGGIYMVAPVPSDTVSLVDSVVVSNCHAICQDGSGGYGISLSGGVVRNSLFIFNSPSGNLVSGSGGAVRASGGVIENCTIAFNESMYGASGVHASGTAKVRDCIICENTLTDETKTPLMQAWTGTASCFENCVCSIEINDDRLVEEHPFASLAPLDLSPSAGSKAFDGGVERDWMAGALDILGRPRVVGDAPDIGAAEAPDLGFAVGFSSPGSVYGFGPLKVSFKVTARGAEADELDCYWDWGDGSEEELLEGDVAEHTFGFGIWSVRLRAVNRTTGEVFVVPDALEVKSIARTLYVRDGDQMPVPPYATWDTAAADIGSAHELALDGCEIVVADGVCRADKEIVVSKVVTIRGLGGRQGTVVRSVGSGHRVFRLGNPDAKICDLTVCDASLSGSGAGIYIASEGGTVSNVFVHSCTSSGYGGSGGGIYVANSDAAVVDAVIVSNCTAQCEDSCGTALAMYGGTVRNSLFVCQRPPSVANFITPMGTVAVRGGTLANCTVARNTSSLCAGIYATGGRVVNCLVSENESTNEKNPTYGVYACDELLLNSTFVNCLGERRMSTSSAVGVNVFRKSSVGDFRLTRTSPAKDRGVYESWMNGALDLRGNPRVRNRIPDVGAYEFQDFGFGIIVK